jgi:hypothetical protein
MATNWVTWKACGTIVAGITSTAALTFMLGSGSGSGSGGEMNSKSDHLDISPMTEEFHTKTTEIETKSMLPTFIHKKDKCLFLAT